MPIPEDVFNQVKCCLFNDDHVAVEPITVSCGAIGCKQCVSTSESEEIECFSCKQKHETDDLKKSLVIRPIENIVKSYVSDLLEYVKINLDKTASLLEGIK